LLYGRPVKDLGLKDFWDWFVESPFAALRLRTDAARRYKKVDNATAVIWKMLMVAEGRFRRLNAPERMKQVFLGVQFKDGIGVKQEAVDQLAA
jgi:putative transposase